MTLSGRRINTFIAYGGYLVGSGDLDISVSSTNFQKNNIGWPQQPPMGSEIIFFFGIFDRDDQTIRNLFFDEMKL